MQKCLNEKTPSFIILLTYRERNGRQQKKEIGAMVEKENNAVQKQSLYIQAKSKSFNNNISLLYLH